MQNKPVLKILSAILFVIIFCYSPVSAGESIQITDAHFSNGTLILNGTNFDSFGQPNITIGDSLLRSCEVATSQITCDISATPAADGGSWRISVSSGSSPHTNAVIDAFNSVANPSGCIPGDFNDCYQGEAGTKGVGICRSGTRACLSSGMWDSECIGQVSPADESPLAETCQNGLDDDCDGLADEDDDDCCGILAEICDGVDNNCNGLIDEGLIGVGVEYCNGKDDNCNGLIDEGYNIGSYCSVGLGPCTRTGTKICYNSGSSICSVSPGTPGVEICNGIDDDCDGSVDDIPIKDTSECCEWHYYACGPFLTDTCQDCIKTYDLICTSGANVKVCQ